MTRINFTSPKRGVKGKIREGKRARREVCLCGRDPSSDDDERFDDVDDDNSDDDQSFSKN